MVDVLVETGPVVVIVPDVLSVLVLGQHAVMLVVGVVLHAAATYMPPPPLGWLLGQT